MHLPLNTNNFVILNLSGPEGSTVSARNDTMSVCRCRVTAAASGRAECVCRWGVCATLSGGEAPNAVAASTRRQHGQSHAPQEAQVHVAVSTTTLCWDGFGLRLFCLKQHKFKLSGLNNLKIRNRWCVCIMHGRVPQTCTNYNKQFTSLWNFRVNTNIFVFILCNILPSLPRTGDFAHHYFTH
jgi:hypothetical protein